MHHHFHAASSHRRLLTVAITALVIAVPATASAATVYHASMKGEHAYAAFASASPDGCVHIFTEVFANDGQTTERVTGHSSSSTAQLGASIFDECQGTFHQYFGSVDLARDQFTAGKTTATLTASVPAVDDTAGTTATFAINLTWTATGQPTATRTIEHTASDGSKSVFRSFGMSVDASATGTVTNGGTSLTPNPSQLAFIGSAKSGQLLITKP